MIISQQDMILPQWSAPARVRAVTSTRAGGVSSGVFGSNNLADYTGDDPVAVAKNWQIMQHSLDYDRLARVSQVHGNRVIDALTACSGDNEADAIVCTEPGIACAILTADCLPVIVTDDSGSQVAVAHCGWRGLAGNILHNLVNQFRQPEVLHAWIGPGICRNCYTVDSRLYQTFDSYSHCFTRISSDQWQCDLSAIATSQLSELGVSHIAHCRMCTFEHDKTLYSYRRDGQTGRIATLAWLGHE